MNGLGSWGIFANSLSAGSGKILQCPVEFSIAKAGLEPVLESLSLADEIEIVAMGVDDDVVSVVWLS